MSNGLARELACILLQENVELLGRDDRIVWAGSNHGSSSCASPGDTRQWIGVTFLQIIYNGLSRIWL